MTKMRIIKQTGGLYYYNDQPYLLRREAIRVARDDARVAALTTGKASVYVNGTKLYEVRHAVA